MAVKLQLVEGRGFFQHLGIGHRRDLPLEVGDALTERHFLRQLDKSDQIAAASAAVAEQQILAGVDVEGRPGFRMQGTEAHELRTRAHAAPSSGAAANNPARGCVA